MGSQNDSIIFVFLPLVVEVVSSVSCFQVLFLLGPSSLVGISSVDTGGQVHRLIRDCALILVQMCRCQCSRRLIVEMDRSFETS